MAEKVDNQVVEEKPVATPPQEKTPVEQSAAPETGKTASEQEIPDKEDIDNMVSILNEIENINGGKNKISAVPPELKGSIRFMIEKLIAYGELFSDPLYKAVLEDMADQREDGKTPSLLVAIARNVPMDELNNLADNENYADVQGAVDERLNKESEDKKAEEAIFANIDSTKKNYDSYCKKMGYDENEKKDLWSVCTMLMKVFADALISEDEFGQIDKMRNYDKDMSDLQSQIPAEPTKEVLPDKASIESSMQNQSKPKTAAQPNSALAMSVPQTDFLNTGKRKFMNNRK